MATQLKAGLWNCRSISPKKKTELLNWASHNTINILLLTETWLHPTTHFRLRNYSLLPHDRQDGYGGVAIVIHNKLNFTPIKITNNHPNIQILAIKIGIYTVAAMYVLPGTSMNTQYWTSIILQLTHPIIITDDFNAHHLNGAVIKLRRWENFFKPPQMI